MDQYAEQLVKKIPTSKDEMQKILLLITAAVLTFATIWLSFLFPLALVLPVCIIWITIYLLRLQKVEYEYSCTNGTLDIDKILGQTKRASLLSVDVKSFTAYGKAGTCPQSDEEMTTFIAVGTSLMGEGKGGQEYYAEFSHPDHGKCCLYFSPNERLREVLEPFLPRTLR